MDDVDRIIDTAPHARNEKMANFLRMVHICEARGSGFDRMEEGLNDWKIPAARVTTTEDTCQTTLYWRESLSKWTKEDKIRTCYIYVCYCYVNGIEVANTVLRERFGISEANKAMVSRIIKDTVSAVKGCLFKDDKEEVLTKNEMIIFQLLLERHGEIVSRDELMTALWDNDEYINDNALSVNISRLRGKLLNLGFPEAIETRKKQGYLLK